MENFLNNTELAYIAGYIDGDGCFYIGKTTNKKTGRTRYQAFLTISSTNKTILEVFKSKYGGSVRLSDSREKYSAQKPQYQFLIKGHKAANLAKNIQIFLTEKSYQAELFYKFIEISNEYIRESNIKFMQDMKQNFYLVNETRMHMIAEQAYFETAFPCDYAYLAGLIDAECSLGIQVNKPKNKPNPTFKIYLSCNNTRYPIFEFMVKRFGGRLYFINRKKSNPNHKDQFHWRLSGKALEKILPLILPHLSYKKPVCEKLIELSNLKLPNGGDRQSAAFKQSYAKILDLKMEIVNHVHSLNQKGI